MLARLAREPLWQLRAAALLIFFLLWLPWSGYWLDDAFITFRYARNLADGLGPVFNPGESVEGYTTFLWMVLCALPFALLPEQLALRAIELGGLVLGAFVLWRACDFPAPDGTPRVRPLAALLAVSPVFVANCGDGMETPLFMALLLEMARVFPRAGSLREGALTGLLAAACVLTRPEALPLLAVLPLLRALTGGRGTGPWALGFGAAALPGVLAQLVWRAGFYGALLPNTFAAKATGAIAPRLRDGLADLLAFLSGTGALPPFALWLAIALAAGGLWAGFRDPTPARRRWLAGLWTVVAFRVAFDLWSGSEYMGTFRFLAPALPPLFVLADEGTRRLSARTARRLVGPLVAVGLAAGFSSIALARAREPYRAGLENAHVALGRWLAESQPAGTWLAVGDAGAIPFFSRLPTIDLWGLSDATIAHLPGEYGKRTGVADYALGRRPGVVVLWNLAPIEERPGSLRILGAQSFDREIAGHPVFRDEYRFAREFVFRPAARPGTGYYLDVFLRRPERPRPGPVPAS